MTGDPQREPRGLGEIVSAAKDFSGKARYPVPGFQRLGAAPGGENAPVTAVGERPKVGDLRDVVPAEYFPIESEDDLVMKVASAFASDPGRSFEPALMGETLSAPPGDHPAPPEPPAQHPQLRGHQQLKGNVPG